MRGTRVVRAEGLEPPEPSDTWFTVRTATIYGISTHILRVVGFEPTMNIPRCLGHLHTLSIGGSSRTCTHNTLITCYSFSRRAPHLAGLLPFMAEAVGSAPTSRISTTAPLAVVWIQLTLPRFHYPQENKDKIK